MSRSKSAAWVSAFGVVVAAILGGLVGRSSSRVDVSPEILQVQRVTVIVAAETIEKLYDRATTAEKKVEGLEKALAEARRKKSIALHTSKSITEGPVKPPEPPQNPWRKEGGGLAIALLPCSLNGDTVSCDFTVESLDDDRFECLRSARLIESNGREIKPSHISLATEECVHLVRRIPIRGSIRFAGLTSSIEDGTLRLFELKFDLLDAQFEYVPLG